MTAIKESIAQLQPKIKNSKLKLKNTINITITFNINKGK